MSIFSEVKLPERKRSTFNLSNHNMLSCEMGYLVPVKNRLVCPGDHIKMSVDAFVRFAPMVAPVMQNFNVYIEAFFTPWRLLMSHDYYESWNDPSSGLCLPQLHRINSPYLSGLTGDGTLWDYLNFPSLPDSAFTLSTSGENSFISLPFKAYQLIWNEYYRDQNVMNEVDIYPNDVNITDSQKVQNLLQIRKRCFKKDYFTSALPFTQRGDDVMMPVSGDVTIGFNPSNAPKTRIVTKEGYTFDGNEVFATPNELTGDGYLSTSQTDSQQQQYRNEAFDVDNSEVLSGSISNVTSPIENLRTAMTIQNLLSLFARAGSRLKERFMALWGVAPPDLRIMRPKFLGQSVSPVVIGEVLQTSSSNSAAESGESTTEQGNMAGHGMALNSGYLFDEKFDEFGYITVLLSVVPKQAYFQGLPRHYSYKTFYDVPNPALAHLGEQAVLQQEIVFNGPNAQPTHENDETFGYQSRYAEVKYCPDEIHGDFRGNLLFWHGARKFDNLNPPRLNSQFLEVSTPEQIFAVNNLDNDSVNQRLYCQVGFDVVGSKLFPYYGTPQFPV